MANDYVLRPFVSGRSPGSEAAVRTLRRVCALDLGHRDRIEVIDVLDDPATAAAAGVIATPPPIRSLPPPLRRLIGDLSQRGRILVGLDLLGTLGGARDAGREG